MLQFGVPSSVSESVSKNMVLLSRCTMEGPRQSSQTLKVREFQISRGTKARKPLELVAVQLGALVRYGGIHRVMESKNLECSWETTRNGSLMTSCHCPVQ